MSGLSDYRKMRILLMFDLPSVEKDDISNNQKFVKELKKIGFYMLQYSVYTRNITNHSEYERINIKVRKIIPNKGNIIIIKITDKQYNDMIYLRGEKNKYDMIVGSNNVVYIGGSNDWIKDK